MCDRFKSSVALPYTCSSSCSSHRQKANALRSTESTVHNTCQCSKPAQRQLYLYYTLLPIISRPFCMPLMPFQVIRHDFQCGSWAFYAVTNPLEQRLQIHVNTRRFATHRARRRPFFLNLARDIVKRSMKGILFRSINVCLN